MTLNELTNLQTGLNKELFESIKKFEDQIELAHGIRVQIHVNNEWDDDFKKWECKEVKTTMLME